MFKINELSVASAKPANKRLSAVHPESIPAQSSAMNEGRRESTHKTISTMNTIVVNDSEGNSTADRVGRAKVQEGNEPTALEEIEEEASKDVVWRICLDGDWETSDNPLISPCRWSGTMKYIHLKWLTEWLESKKIAKDGKYFRSFCWEMIFCELWKEEFQSTVYWNGKNIWLLGYEVPENGNYLVLEALNTEEIIKK